ncbi:MAG TPA: arsenate reductase family protein [Blastocatellia bacterium]|nr:arsenate reductase family protein [Blastocatellia bacterium]
MKGTIDFYWLPNCTTCQKAKSYLDGKGTKVGRIRDIKSDPLSRAEVEDLAGLVGGPENLFSRRAIKYRELGLANQNLSNQDLLRLMSEEYTFIKRPVIVRGNKAVAGFNAKQVDNLVDS